MQGWGDSFGVFSMVSGFLPGLFEELLANWEGGGGGNVFTVHWLGWIVLGGVRMHHWDSFGPSFFL